MRLGAGIWAVTLAGARRRDAPICNRSFTNPSHAHVNPTGGSLGPFMRTLTRQVVAWGSSPTARPSSAWSEPSSPNKTTNGPKADATSASTSSPDHDSHPNPPNRRTPHSNSAHNPTRRTQNDYTTPQDLTLQPMTPLQPLMQASMKTPSPLHAPEQQPLKPPSPLHPKSSPKTPFSHPQRRQRFQLRLGLRPQRRRRFQPHTDTSAQRRQRFQTTGPPGRQSLTTAPVGGGWAWPGFEATRRAKLAARTARGRAAAHGHTKQPGPTAGPSGTRNTRGATSNIATPHAHTKTPTRNRVGVSEPPVGIEPTTYSLRVNRSAD